MARVKPAVQPRQRPRGARYADEALQRLAHRAGRVLLAQQRQVATAESCTGGWIAKALTDIAGSSAWFDAGFVTYSNNAKTRQLGVPARTIAAEGAVSEAVVRAMAAGALRLTGVSDAIAVSGIAGPGGAVPGKPVGTVWLCWARAGTRSIHYRTELCRFRGDRELVRRKTVQLALLGLLRP